MTPREPSVPRSESIADAHYMHFNTNGKILPQKKMANLGNKDKQHTYNSTPKSCAIKQLTITLNLAVVNTLKVVKDVTST